MSLRLMIILFLSVIMYSCQKKADSKLLLGTWQVDSTLKVYNQFSYKTYSGSDFATYFYLPKGQVLEIRDTLFRRYTYEYESDSQKLVYLTPSGSKNEYELLEINQEQLVLKQYLPGIFGSDNQNRYEIRFFKRIDSTGIRASLKQELSHF